MTKPTVSFIIPAYNAGENIRRCLDSVLAQSQNGFEVLIVNDGSQDDTAGICNEYSRKDQRIRLFNKQNGGVSSARNLALNHVSGDYICFIDSDDWIEPDYLAHIIQNLEPGNALVIFNHHVIAKRRTYIKHAIEDVTYRKDEYSEVFNKLHFLRNGYVWSKIFSTEIIKKHNIRFDEDISFAEDLLFNLEYFKHVELVKFCNYAGYHYVHNNPHSLSVNYHSFKRECNGFERLKSEMLSVMESNKLDEAARIYIYTWLAKFLLRSLQALHRKQSEVPSEARMQLLSQSHRPEHLRYLQYTKYLNLQPKIELSVYLYTKRYLVLYDTYMMLLFKGQDLKARLRRFRSRR